MVWDGMGYASKIHILLLSQFKANHPWQERFAGDISSGVGAATFALKWLDEALQEQYGNKHSDEAMKDFDGVIRVLIIGDLGAALLNGLGATREHFQLMKTMCTTCGAAPVAQVGDGYLKEPISGYGRLAMQAQTDLPIENTNGSPSVGDDVSTLLIWMADFEADMHAQLAALGATGEEACIRGQLQRGGLTPDIKRRLPGVSEATQRARTHASPAWLAVHPGGDLAWEHQYLRAFLEFAAAQMFLMRRDPVWAVYQMRQTPPAVLNAARATEYRIAPQQLRKPDPSLPQPIPTPTHPYTTPSLPQPIPTPTHPYPNPSLPQPIPTPTHPYRNPSLPQPIPTPTYPYLNPSLPQPIPTPTHPYPNKPPSPRAT